MKAQAPWLDTLRRVEMHTPSVNKGQPTDIDPNNGPAHPAAAAPPDGPSLPKSQSSGNVGGGLFAQEKTYWEIPLLTDISSRILSSGSNPHKIWHEPRLPLVPGLTVSVWRQYHFRYTNISRDTSASIVASQSHFQGDGNQMRYTCIPSN